MTSRDFCFWLQGYFELNGLKAKDDTLDHHTVQVIKRHLDLVFKHEIDPSMGPQSHQDALNAIHNLKPGETLRC